MSNETKISDVDKAEIIDDGRAPHILVDGYCGMTGVGGIGRFSFFCVEYDPLRQQSVRRVVLDLQLPFASLAAITASFAEVLNGMQRQSIANAAQKPAEGPN